MFFDQFKQLCDSAGKSPSAVGKELGISSGAVSMWKTGARRPRTDQLQKIADYFGVSIDYLLGIEKAATLSDDGYSEKKKKLLKAVEQMTVEQAELLLSLWEQFKAGK